MTTMPLGIGRISRVQESDGATIKVRIEVIPPGARLPEQFERVGSYVVTLMDPERTPMHVTEVNVFPKNPSLVLTIVPPRGVTSGKFRVRIENFVPGLDVVEAVWGLGKTATDPGAALRAADRIIGPPAVPNYLYRDYESFKQLMLDTLHREVPRIRETHEADASIAAIEVLAFSADHLSYFQDAVATEGYLETARRRVSVRRHCRLLDYHLLEGCSPRVWIHVCPEAPVTIPPGFAFRAEGLPRTDARVFEAIGANEVTPNGCGLRVWDFGGAERELPAGRTTTILDAAQHTKLHPGDVLIFQQSFDPITGVATPPSHRQAVRLVAPIIPFPHPEDPARMLLQISWDSDDRLQRSYDLRRSSDGESATHVFGNIVEADFGETFHDPTAYVLGTRGTIHVPIRNLTFAVPEKVPKLTVTAEYSRIRPLNAVPQITAISEAFTVREEWTARRDLIGADPYGRQFVVESEDDTHVTLRFGDGVNGVMPAPHSLFYLRYRRGCGTSGHVGPNAVDIRGRVDGIAIRALNPLPSYGGFDRQSIAQARRDAPARVHERLPLRCVSDGDYVRVARAVPGVRAATVRRRWTGSGSTVQVYVDGSEGSGGSTGLQARVAESIGRARIIGTDFNVRGPHAVGIFVEITIRIAPGTSAGDVARRAAQEATAALDREHITLGSTIFASWLVAAAMRTPGVTEAWLSVFQRYDGADARTAGAIACDATEKPLIVDDQGIAGGNVPVVKVVE